MAGASLALVLGSLLMAQGAMANGTPDAPAICGGLEVVDMSVLGITMFDAAQFTPQDPTAGLCILGTDEADTIFGTEFGDIILGFKGRKKKKERSSVLRSG